ncbi:MAG: SBBP repeat-containing protein, partial [Candidatus Kariarchaeaceae archaeon]
MNFKTIAFFYLIITSSTILINSELLTSNAGVDKSEKSDVQFLDLQSDLNSNNFELEAIDYNNEESNNQLLMNELGKPTYLSNEDRENGFLENGPDYENDPYINYIRDEETRIRREIAIPFSGFMENYGQNNDSDIFYYYTSEESWIGFGNSKIIMSQAVPSYNELRLTYTLSFKGATSTNPVGRRPNFHSTNYFIGNMYYTDIPSWDEVWYYNIYPNIDLRYFMTTEGLKYEFLVHSGGDPSDIIIELSENVGITVLSKSVIFHPFNKKELEIGGDSELRVFQKDGKKINAEFTRNSNPKLEDRSYSFVIPEYDQEQMLIIDPLLLGFSTYIGGVNDDTGINIAIDSLGYIYVTGSTHSSNFPVFNAYNSTFGGSGGYNDMFVVKLNSTGNGIVFSTFVGGSSSDSGSSIIIDSEGNSYIIGTTSSSNFPVFNAYNTTYGGGGDVFVLRLNASGNGLHFSTYIGGSGNDIGYNHVVDSQGNSYVVGYTTSSNFPMINAYDSTIGGSGDGFVFKLNNTGNGLSFSSYIGGSNTDKGFSIDLDSQGNSYIIGYTGSNDFPVFNAYNSTFGGSNDIFVTKLNSTGNGLIFSTYIGGSSSDSGEGIAIDDQGNSYITGYTWSNNFPVINAYNTTYGGSKDVFVLKLNSTGNGLHFSTYIGGSGNDEGHAIVIDSQGNSYITGSTGSVNFPTMNAYNDTFGGYFDIFLTKLNSTGDGAVFSTYVGGSSIDIGNSIAIDSLGNSYITGYTGSNNFPVLNAFNSTFSGGYDVFMMKLTSNTAPQVTDALISPSNPTNISILSVSYTYSDLDSDPENTSFREIRWYKNDILESFYNNLLFLPNTATTKGEVWKFGIRVHDGKEYSAWENSTSVTILNTAPTASNIGIFPALAETNDDLIAFWIYSDVDLDT